MTVGNTVRQRSIVLVGLMGTGKTTTGRLLAEQLGLPYVDTDDLIIARTGRTVREIFRADGEAAFRTLEAAVLVEALAPATPVVLAAAGGVVLSEANRGTLREADALVVWLRADPALLVRRVEGQEHRPLLDDDPVGTLTQMHRDREPLYREVADVVIDVDELKPAEVADRVLAAATAEPS
jgi:shikimate kinase